MSTEFRLPWGIKIAAACGAQVFNMIAPQDVGITVLLAAVTVGCFMWGAWDLLENVKVYRDGAMPNSDTSAKYENSVKRNIVGIASLLIIIIAIAVYAASSYKAQYTNAVGKLFYVKQHSLHLPSHIVMATFDGALIREFYSHERAMIVCRLPDSRIDEMDDVNIDKSAAHDVVNGDFAIQLDINQDIVRRMTAGRDFIQCHLALLPNGTTPDQIKSLRQLIHLRGVVLNTFMAAHVNVPR